MLRILLILNLLLISSQALASQEDMIEKCAPISIASARLTCYDEFVRATKENISETVYTGTAVPNSTDQTVSKKEPVDYKYFSLANLTSDDPNFFGISSSAGSTDRGVETHIEFDISVKYPLWRWSEKGRALFIYNGAYDFQAITGSSLYDSSPVISTAQNPGVALEWDLGKNGNHKFRFGYHHHSNGQTLSEPDITDDPKDRNGNPWATVDAVNEYTRIRNAWGKAPALERISRSSWYTQFRYQWMSNQYGIIDDNWKQIQIEYRALTKTDDNVFWPPIPERQPKLEQFDGIRFVAEKMYPFRRVRLLPRIELQTGASDTFKNIGGTISLGINPKNLAGYNVPFIRKLINTENLLINLSYFSGFTKDIAAYHKRTKYLGFGFELR